MIEIIPAIIPENFADLENHLTKVVGLSKTVQIDVLDGTYIAGRASWPYRKADENFKKIIEEAEGMPLWDKFNFEIHLMLKEPETKIEEWLRAGAERVIVHPDATHSLDHIIETYTGALDVSIAIGIGVNLESLGSYLEKVTSIQCMGIKHVGYQGEPIDSSILSRVREVREKYPNHVITVDGGVTIDNAADLVHAGANRLVVGSAIFASQNPGEVIRMLQKVA